MKGVIFLTLLLTVCSYPAEDRETTLLHKDFNELSVQLHEHFESYEVNEGARSAIYKDIEKVIADLAQLKAVITNTAEDAACDPDQPEDDYKLCVLMEQAQDVHVELAAELPQDDIVDIHSISKTVAVLAEEDVEEDSDSDLDAMDKTLAEDKEEEAIFDDVADDEEEVADEGNNDYLERLLGQGQEAFEDEGQDVEVADEVADAVAEEEEIVEEEKDDYLEMLLGQGEEAFGQASSDDDVIDSELDVLEGLEKEAAEIAQLEREQSAAEKAAKAQADKLKAMKELAVKEQAEREQAERAEGALSMLSPADQAAAEMEREEQMEEALRALEI